MTTELTKAAQQALEVLKSATSFMSKKARDQHPKTVARLERALTTSQPTQATPSSANRTLCDYFLNPNLSPVLSFDDDKQATPEPVGEVFYACPDELEMLRQRTVKHCLLSTFKAHGEKDVTLYARRAPGVPEGFALVPVEPTPQMTTLVEHDMWDKPFVNGADVWSAVLAAAQAKGADPEDLAAAGVMLMGRRADHA